MVFPEQSKKKLRSFGPKLTKLWSSKGGKVFLAHAHFRLWTPRSPPCPSPRPSRPSGPLVEYSTWTMGKPWPFGKKKKYFSGHKASSTTMVALTKVLKAMDRAYMSKNSIKSYLRIKDHKYSVLKHRNNIYKLILTKFSILVKLPPKNIATPCHCFGSC